MFSWEEYSASPLVTVPPARLREADVTRILQELKAIRPDGIKLQEIGKSHEGRPIFSVTIGSGQVRVFAWSQMHGNEPTHTAVLLDLIDLLQRHPEKAISREILSGCTLTLVPMLNPDGAERYSRRNAQDIDINRDALHLATPEGRLLRRMVEQVKPHFAFNLHNQQAGTSVDGFHVAAVSLLVPPIDKPDTQTEWVEQAKQVAAIFIDAVKPHCEGMISRYDADFMPRCFGEWVQQQKIATLTVEAGGWSTVDTSPLVQLHFLGMINALAGIANGCYATVEPKKYDELPRSSDQYLFDVVIRDAAILTDEKQAPFNADLGINFTKPDNRLPVERCGRIDDFGDLCVTTGKKVFDAKGLSCVPGRIAYVPSIYPQKLPSDAQAQYLLRQGVTTVIGSVDLAQSAQLDSLEKLREADNWPLNVGFVGTLSNTIKQDSAIREQLVRAIALGVLGLVAEDATELQSILDWFRLPLLKVEELSSPDKQPATASELVITQSHLARKLSLHSRGTIKLGMVADLLCFAQTDQEALSWDRLRWVMLGGRVVLDNGQLVPGASGDLLLR